MKADLTSEERAALFVFAGKYGPRWKAELANQWFDGRDAREPDGHLLRRLRNRLGPAWLKRIKATDWR